MLHCARASRAASSIRVVEEHKCFPKSIRSQLPLPCRDAIDAFLIAQDEGRRYFAPQATTTMELEVFTILTCFSLSHGPKGSNDCCQARNQELNFIIHHISTIWNTVFNAHEGFSVKWQVLFFTLCLLKCALLCVLFLDMVWF